jgi:Ser/Thr protein kinase RdoA (MazF antagonist)
MEDVAAHLAKRYGLVIERLVRLDEEVYRVEGPEWVVRRFPPGARDAADATAELLRRLAPTPFPAEHLAHPEPVSECGDRPMLVTEFVLGPRAPATPRMFALLGGLLGALHARSGHTLPPGGGWHHLVAQGTPTDEIAATIVLLERADGDLSARETLLDELRRLDDCADLPHGIVHPDFVPANVIRSPEQGSVVIDWAGSGRGPRLWSLGFLLWAAGARDLQLVDAVLRRYRDHVQLGAEELGRLPDAIRGRALTLDCWSAAHGRMDWAEVIERLDENEDLANEIANQVRRVCTT